MRRFLTLALAALAADGKRQLARVLLRVGNHSRDVVEGCVLARDQHAGHLRDHGDGRRD